MVTGFLRKAAVSTAAGLLLTGLPGAGTASAVPQVRVVYSIEFDNPGEPGDPEPYGTVVLRLSEDQERLWHQARTDDVPTRWR